MVFPKVFVYAIVYLTLLCGGAYGAGSPHQTEWDLINNGATTQTSLKRDHPRDPYYANIGQDGSAGETGYVKLPDTIWAELDASVLYGGQLKYVLVYPSCAADDCLTEAPANSTGWVSKWTPSQSDIIMTCNGTGTVTTLTYDIDDSHMPAVGSSVTVSEENGYFHRVSFVEGKWVDQSSGANMAQDSFNTCIQDIQTLNILWDYISTDSETANLGYLQFLAGGSIPKITAISPSEGWANTASRVKIDVTGLENIAPVCVFDTTEVDIDESEIHLSQLGDGYLYCNTPAANGSVSVAVCAVTNSETSLCSEAKADGFTFRDAGVSSISPTTGPARGETVITIAAANFDSDFSWKCKWEVGNEIIERPGNHVNGTIVTCLTPPSDKLVNVSYVAVYPVGFEQALSSKFEFQYYADEDISSISPSSGYYGKEHNITVSGQNFVDGNICCKIGEDGESQKATFVSSTEVQCTVPAVGEDALNTAEKVFVSNNCDQYGDSHIEFSYREAGCDEDPEPVINIDSPINVVGLDLVTLDATNSTDGNNTAALSFSWDLLDRPTDSELLADKIVGSEESTAYFRPDVAGTYIIGLSVLDACRGLEKRVSVVVTCPTGPTVSISGGAATSVGLLGQNLVADLASPLPDGLTVTYIWEVVSKPDGASGFGRFTGRDDNKVVFTPSDEGDWVVKVTVTDGCYSESATASMSFACSISPEADAGPDQTVLGLTEVQLHGRGYDDDTESTALTFTWMFAEVPFESNLVSSDINNADTFDATFTPDVPGIYTLRLEVSDSCAPATSTLRIHVFCTTAPTVDAGEDFSVAVNTPAELSGEATYEKKDEDVQYRWSIVQKPHASHLGKEIDSTEKTASFVPDAIGYYEIRFVVTDSCHSIADRIVVTVCDQLPCSLDTCHNALPPIAHVDDEIEIAEGAWDVTLDGRGSSDPDGRALSYKWTFWSLPKYSYLRDVDIDRSTRSIAYFKPDVRGFYRIKLTVSDGCGSSYKIMDVDVLHTQYPDVERCQENVFPYVDAGEDEIAHVGQEVTLHAHSSDRDSTGDYLIHHWKITSVPEGSNVHEDQLIGRHGSLTPRFTPDVAGQYDFVIQVSDACDTVIDTVSVHVRSVPETLSKHAHHDSAAITAHAATTLQPASSRTPYVFLGVAVAVTLVIIGFVMKSRRASTTSELENSQDTLSIQL